MPSSDLWRHKASMWCTCRQKTYINKVLDFFKDYFIEYAVAIFDTPEEGTRSHYRWLCAIMWLVGIELKTSGKAGCVLNLWAIFPAQKNPFYLNYIFCSIWIGLVVLVIKSRAFHMLGKSFTTDLLIDLHLALEILLCLIKLTKAVKLSTFNHIDHSYIVKL